MLHVFFYGYVAHRDLHSFPTRRSSDLVAAPAPLEERHHDAERGARGEQVHHRRGERDDHAAEGDRKSTRLNSSHANISYAVFCLKKKKDHKTRTDDDSQYSVH